MAKPSILYLINVLGYGGAEIQVSRLATGMKRRGHEVTVVTLVPPIGLADELRAAGVDVLTLDMRPGRPSLRGLLRLVRILRERRPQVVHSHIVHANLIARVVRPFAPMPALICTAHSVTEGSRWLELAYRYTDRLADLTTNVSQAAVDRYVRIKAAPAERIRFVPNGLDVTVYRHDAAARDAVRRELGVEGRFVWLAVGRLSEPKDVPTMLRAFAQVEDPRAVLLLVGRGPLEGEVRLLIDSLGLGERVRLLGLRHDIGAVMSAADAYVMSSAWEGMPLVLQEASAAGLPIVATEVGGTAEVVERDRSGLLVPPKDPAALAAAMRRLTSMTPDERAEMGRAGCRHVTDRYDLERVLDVWEAAYAEQLDRRAGRPARDAAAPLAAPYAEGAA